MLHFGLFGAGRIGRVHAASLATHPRTELVVVHDPVEVAASEVAAQYGATPTGDADAILGDPGIDAVIIASPTATHVDLLTASVRAGKAVLCEKPIDLDLARVDACWAEIKGLDGAVMVGFNRGSTRPSPSCATGSPRARSAGSSSSSSPAAIPRPRRPPTSPARAGCSGT
jgi:myo-inositol 2-dehydrogenase / D-chiro-inositol 1-dehydrogenase